MPHISLGYGVTAEQRASILAALEQELSGETIRFDTIAVISSAQSVPIENWKIVHTLSLG
jgi:hypothetical protein